VAESLEVELVGVHDGTATPFVLNTEMSSGVHGEPREIVARIYALHATSLHRYLLLSGCQPADADELLQEAFLRLFRALRQGEQLENPKAWLIRVLQNLRTDKARKESVYSYAAPEEFSGMTPAWAGHRPSPEEALIDQERFDRLHEAMRSLSERQYQYLLLRSEGLTFREIAELHSVAIQSVAETCARAIERLGILTHE
jgi:RNA polymerase sigma-70 factor (ECF subfamily)